MNLNKTRIKLFSIKIMKLAKFALISLMAIVVASCGSSSNDHGDHDGDHSDSTATTDAAPVSYAIDGASSSVEWTGDVIGIYKHTGTAAVKEGSLNTANGAITGGEFVVDLTQLTTTDSNYTDKNPSSALIGHLQKDDFFNTDSFPTASFKVTSVEGSTITGDLTIRGTTFEESIEDVTLSEEGGNVTASGSMTFERRKYGVKWEHYLKDHTLSNDIVLNISVKGNAG